MRGLLLYNVDAGRGHIEREIEAIVEVFRNEGHTIEPRKIVFGHNPFDGAEDCELAVIAGGDGTINYVVNMMYEKGITPLLGIIPRGTANDFAGAIGMPRNALAAARQIARGKEHNVDCGEVNGSRFVNVFSFGVLTTTSQQTPDIAKHRFGKMAYLWVGSRDLATMHPMLLNVTHDNGSFDCQAAMVLVFNGKSAGRFRLAPGAEIDDGMFDIVILEYDNIVALCWNMARYMIGRNTLAVRCIRSSKVRITAPNNETTDVDGQRGPDLPIELKCLKHHLRVLY